MKKNKTITRRSKWKKIKVKIKRNGMNGWIRVFQSQKKQKPSYISPTFFCVCVFLEICHIHTHSKNSNNTNDIATRIFQFIHSKKKDGRRQASLDVYVFYPFEIKKERKKRKVF